VSEIGKGPRKCQSIVHQQEGSWVFFAPSADDPKYFENYISRINSAGWRPIGDFPVGVDASGIDLRRARIKSAGVPARPTVWNQANLSEADFSQGILRDDDFTEAFLRKSDFTGCCGDHVVFAAADLSGSNFSLTLFAFTNFASANLQQAQFSIVQEAFKRLLKDIGSAILSTQTSRAQI
jgi:uncharacterized protein YjbI with pentapeptide repeats